MVRVLSAANVGKESKREHSKGMLIYLCLIAHLPLAKITVLKPLRRSKKIAPAPENYFFVTKTLKSRCHTIPTPKTYSKMSKIGQLSAEIEYPEHVKFFVDTHGIKHPGNMKSALRLTMFYKYKYI